MGLPGPCARDCRPCPCVAGGLSFQMGTHEEAMMMKNWTVDDVLTHEVVTVDASASYRYLVDLLTAGRHRDPR